MKKISLVLLCALGVLLLPAQNASQSQDSLITLEDIWSNYRYLPDFASSFRWMQDDAYYTTLEEPYPAIWKNSITGKTQIEAIVRLDQLDFGDDISAGDIKNYVFGPKEKKVLLKARAESIYRRSTREITYVYDTEDESLQVLHDGEKVSNATFSPSARRVAYNHDNNLYYHILGTGERVQVTDDGKWKEVINGSTDWVYEEELSLTRAFEWSPDGRYLAYLRFDEREVKQFNMPIYGELYPNPYEFKYPKAGESNSIVTAHLYDLSSGERRQIDLGEDSDVYIARMAWTPVEGDLILMRLNRLQNQLDLLRVDPESGETSVLLSETSETYHEVAHQESDTERFHFLEDGSGFLWQSERSGYNHIYRYDMDGELEKQITSGDWEVIEVVGVDEEEEIIYYRSTETSALERHLYRINFDGKKKKRLTPEPGFHQVAFSSDFSYFVDTYSSATNPGKIVLRNAKGEVLRELKTNERLREQVARLDIAPPTFFSFETESGTQLNGWMIRPPDFDPEKEYPVLMFTYGGPGSQTVKNQWGHGRPFNYMWYQMLAQRGYLIVSVDGRGTGGRGRDFRASTYGDLGRLEVEDQIEAAKWLAKQEYVDGERIGIWGWSYGGYLTSLALTKGNGIFKMGIAVAPVTNWRFYDTIYTERYLKLPQENARGYDENSPINYAADLQGEYLLVHGTADDNVHFQNSMEWVNALIRANKQFDTFFYPNRNHGIFGGNTRFHLYQKMTDFVMENL